MSKTSVNLCMLSGTIVSEVKRFETSTAFKIKSVRKYKDKEEVAEVMVRAFGELGAKSVDLKEGMRVYVEGSLRHLNKELPSGKKHYWTEVNAKDIQVM